MDTNEHSLFYRKQATLLRKLAQTISSSTARADLQIVAVLYDRLATSIEAKAKERSKIKLTQDPAVGTGSV